MAHKINQPSKIPIKDLNEILTCSLCGGYYIDATALVDCLHVFCRACILRHFEHNSKIGCPTCNTVYKKKNHACFRPDDRIQSLVYKLIPGLYAKEVQRREDFYRSTSVRASSSCSDDSVLGDLGQEHEDWVAQNVNEENQYYSPDDSISLSLEYYRPDFDETSTESTNKISVNNKLNNCKISDSKNSANFTPESNNNKPDVCENAKKIDEPPGENTESSAEIKQEKTVEQRFLQCPAAVSMSHLQKFLRMKNGLATDHRVDIIYEGEVLAPHFSLMDVAYTFAWKRIKPMRFFYRIFTPVKVQPIKIINASLNGGEKQLQIVPVKTEPKPEPTLDAESEAENYKNKEKHLEHLELLSKSKFEEKSRKQEHRETCVYEYEEPDKDEIRKFAEKRDREWAMQKQLDEEEEKRHVSKKRKKSKHSKSEVSYKKMKMHAEITSAEVSNTDELKLKVKLTPHNGHKHKHQKNSVNDSGQKELSSKEKLFQMRQVRHKHITNEEKNKSISGEASPKEEEPSKPIEKVKEEVSKAVQTVDVPEEKKKENNGEVPKPPEPIITGKTLRSDFAIKTNANKDFRTKNATVQIERNELTEKHVQKFSLKTFQSYTKELEANSAAKPPPPQIRNLPQNVKSLEKKIANLHQQCTVEARAAPAAKPQILNSAFTVSKIEAGAKRKADGEPIQQDKRPSLEITLVNPSVPTSSPSQMQKNNAAELKQVKRPPPATIPLERIKKSVSLKSGISIIPTMPEKCEALDLSKTGKTGHSLPKIIYELHNNKLLNGGAKTPPTAQKTDAGKPPEKNIQLSNLQMLSKVASEHPSIKSPPPNLTLINKIKPQIPNLQTLKIPVPQIKSPNLAKLPKLNEINKMQFRPLNPQMRMRPNQNQSIRNIPNPSLLVRQQNQNRLNSINAAQNSDKGGKVGNNATKEPNEKEEAGKKIDAKEIPAADATKN